MDTWISILYYYAISHCFAEFVLTSIGVVTATSVLFRLDYRYKAVAIVLLLLYFLSRILYVSFAVSFIVKTPKVLADGGFYLLLFFYAIYGIWSAGLLLRYIISQSIVGYRLDERRKNPTVAVIIPVYNEDPKQLISTIKKAVNQEYEGRLTIFCSFDSYEMNLAYIELLKEYHVEFKQKTLEYGIVDLSIPGMEKHLVICKRQNHDVDPKQYAWNLAQQLDQFEYVLFIDSNVMLNKNVVHNFCMTFTKYPQRVAMTGTIDGSSYHFCDNFYQWKQLPLSCGYLHSLPQSFFIITQKALNECQTIIFHQSSTKFNLGADVDLSRYLVSEKGRESIGLCSLSIAKNQPSSTLSNYIHREHLLQLLREYCWILLLSEYPKTYTITHVLQFFCQFFSIIPFLSIVLYAFGQAPAINLIFLAPFVGELLLLLLNTTRFQMWYNFFYYALYVLFGPFVNLVFILIDLIINLIRGTLDFGKIEVRKEDLESREIKEIVSHWSHKKHIHENHQKKTSLGQRSNRAFSISETEFSVNTKARKNSNDETYSNSTTQANSTTSLNSLINKKSETKELCDLVLIPKTSKFKLDFDK
eukprot:NODE_29_length_37665_cov_1.081563.p4 type:complete len:586 gc:universal NODE_29_length_37665_cov_1.081563:16130-14373(-)